MEEKNQIYHILITQLKVFSISKNNLKPLNCKFVSEFPGNAHDATGKMASKL
jgi:hypothetical protein